MYFIFLEPVFYLFMHFFAKCTFRKFIGWYTHVTFEPETVDNGSWEVSVERGEKKRGEGRVRTASPSLLCIML